MAPRALVGSQGLGWLPGSQITEQWPLIIDRNSGKDKLSKIFFVLKGWRLDCWRGWADDKCDRANRAQKLKFESEDQLRQPRHTMKAQRLQVCPEMHNQPILLASCPRVHLQNFYNRPKLDGGTTLCGIKVKIWTLISSSNPNYEVWPKISVRDSPRKDQLAFQMFSLQRKT